MTARPLSLAHLTVLDAMPPELVSAAAAAGFPHVGSRLTATPSVGVPPYDCLRDGPCLRETLARLKETGITVLDTEFLRFEPDQPVGVPEGFLEVSARLGAKHVLVMSAEPDEARTLDRFGDLCDQAAKYELRVGLEFAVYTGVRTLADAARLVKQSQRANTSVVVDFLHFSRSGGQPAHITAVDPALFHYAQACDATSDMPAPTDTPSLIREARGGRFFPGDGALPLKELVAALPPSIPLAIEAPSAALAHLPVMERARRAHEALRRYAC